MYLQKATAKLNMAACFRMAESGGQDAFVAI
jgi:hypothetical protein